MSERQVGFLGSQARQSVGDLRRKTHALANVVTTLFDALVLDRLSMILGICGIMFAVCGCGVDVSTDGFGSLQRPASVTELNGLGVHQRMWERAGAKCIMPSKLSPLLNQVDAIVLVGTTYAPPGKRARDWLEDWLRQSEGRSVVYFGRDFDAELFYRERTLKQVGTDEFRQARDRWAIRAAENFEERTANVGQAVFCRWFLRSELVSTRSITGLSGPWSTDLTSPAVEWPVGVRLDPPTNALRIRSRAAMVAGFKIPKPKAWSIPRATPSDLVYRSEWAEDEIDTAEKLDAEWDQAPGSEILLAGGDETPLVTRLTSDAFANSQIIIVANAAPFLNGSLVSPGLRQIGTRIVQQCLPAKRVALLAYDDSGILISEIQEQDPRVAGLEMLTVWPLNVIVMHAALLGILACIMLLPVLGRPQPPPHQSLSDFGQHVEAMGSMLLKTDDRLYAQRMIANYFQFVRKESVPSWIQTQTVPALAKKSRSLAHPVPQSSTIPSAIEPAPNVAPVSVHNNALQALGQSSGAVELPQTKSQHENPKE